MSNFGNNTNTNRNTGSVDANAPGAQHHGTAGQKIRGAAEVIHGIGENIRGRLMDAVDGSTGQPHPETQQGRLEVERGMAKITGGAGAGAAGAGAGAGAGGPTSANSGYTQSPSPYDAPTQQQQHQLLQPNRRMDSEYGSPANVQGNNVLGPTSGMTTGFGNGGPEVEMASAPYQQQSYSTGGGEMQPGTNDRDFGHAQRNTMGQQPGSTPGPAPDRYAMGGQPANLP